MFGIYNDGDKTLEAVKIEKRLVCSHNDAITCFQTLSFRWGHLFKLETSNWVKLEYLTY